MPTSHCAVPLSLLFAALLGHAAVAQCTNPWSAENSIAGVLGEVHALHRWDRDGAGPLPAVWVFGGDFLGAGSISANRVVAFDPATQTWSAFGAGVNARVHAFATLPNGNLVVGGEFTTAGGIPTSHIAVWNGSTWAAMGSGFDARVFALAVLPSGVLVAGGQFSTPGAAGTWGIAQWNGSAWAPIGSGLTQGVVRTLAVQPNGDLFAAGSALQLDTSGPIEWVVRWNGTAWAAVGAAVAPPPLFHVNYDLLARANGDVVLVGDSVGELTGGGHRLATWDGTTWTAMPSPAGTTAFRVAELSNGELVVIGSGGHQAYRWTGTSWDVLGDGLPSGVVRTVLALPGNELLVGGTLTSGPDIRNAAHWNGTTWLQVGGGWAGSDARITARPDGSFVVALTQNPISYLGLRTGGSWAMLGSANHVMVLGTMPNGDVIAGGRFTFIGGVFANRIARWDGNAWSPLGSGIGTQPSDYVSALAVMPNGDLIAGGRFNSPASSVARWNGTSWSALGSGLGPVNALAVLPDGGVVAGGAFTLASPGGTIVNIASWNGTLWQAMGPGLNQPVTDVAVRPDGTIVACGPFTLPGGPFGSQLGGPAIWTGVAWSSIGGLNFYGSINSLLTAANGDLVAGGSFATVNGEPHAGIARWNGAMWSGFGAGAPEVTDLTLAPDGDIGVAGNFLQAGGVASPHFARLSTTCPAAIHTIGAGCTGAGGSPELAATSLPWLGTTFRSRATGLPANALVIEVLGHSSLSVPLAAILPQGIAGCMLTTGPDLLQLHLPNAGAVELALPLTNSIAFAGVMLYQQVVALSLGPTFDIVALTSSNSLELVKGWF